MQRSVNIVLFAGMAWGLSGAQQISAEKASTSGETVIAANILISLRTTRALTSKEAKRGDPLELEVMRDVKVGDLLLIPQHSQATATVTSSQHARVGMRGGSLALEVKTVTAITGDVIAVRATKSVRGGPNAGERAEAVVEGRIILSWVPFLFKGEQAMLPKGTAIDVYVDHDVVLDRAQVRDRTLALEAQKAAARTGNGAVHFYDDLLGGAKRIDVDGRPLVKLRHGHIFTQQILPGSHMIRCENTQLSLDVKPDEDYYIRFVSTKGLFWHWVPTLVPHDEGEAQTYPLTASDSKDIFVQLR